MYVEKSTPSWKPLGVGLGFGFGFGFGLGLGLGLGLEEHALLEAVLALVEPAQG